MKKALLMLSVIVIALSSASADVIVLKSGKKVAGTVTKKEDGYELKNEDGQLIGFSLDEVDRVVTKPEELTADADKLYNDAKELFNQAHKIEDLKERNPLYKDGIAKLNNARDIYLETRDLFPQEKTLYIDKDLQDLMQLVVMFRKELVEDEDMPIVAKPSVAPKSAKESEEEKQPEPTSNAEIKKPEEDAKAEVKEQIPDITPAISILTDIKKLSDENARAIARETIAGLADYKGRTPAKNFACALNVFLQGDMYSWDFLKDVLKVKEATSEETFSGKIIRKDKNGLTLHTKQGNVVVASSSLGNSIILPNGSNIKISDYKLDEGKKSLAMGFFGQYLKQVNLQNISGFGVDQHSAAARFLANAVRDVGTENGAGLELLACGHISSALAAGAKEQNLKDIFGALGFEKAYLSWGKPRWLALYDARLAIITGDYDSGSAFIEIMYKDKKDFAINYANAYLKILGAIAKKSGLDKVSANLKTLAKSAPNARAKEHLEALAKSLDNVAPCSKCGGTGKLKCYKCKGKGWVTMKKCPVCNGRGEIRMVSSGGTAHISRCPLCKGKGAQVEIPCQHCGGKFPPLKCPDCNGDGVKKTLNAYGTKVDKCSTCDGTGVNPKFVHDLQPGTGYVKCYKCGGKVAKIPALEDVLSQDTCDQCSGVGFPIPKIAYPCSKCFGLGVIISPLSDPTKKLAD